MCVQRRPDTHEHYRTLTAATVVATPTGARRRAGHA